MAVRDVLHKVEPVRADVDDGPRFAAVHGVHTPVEIGRMEEPVLRIAAGDVIKVAVLTRTIQAPIKASIAFDGAAVISGRQPRQKRHTICGPKRSSAAVLVIRRRIKRT
jgi:hypothetical protein